MSKDNENKDKYVKIKRSDLEDINKKIERLEFAASKKQLSRYDSVHEGERLATASVSKFNGQIVVAWSDLISNIVEKNEKDVWHERQETILTFKNDDELKVNYAQWQREREKIPVTIVEQIHSSKGHSDAKIKLPNGETLTLGVEFLN